MQAPALIADLVVAIVAAFVGGLVAQRLRQPVVLGYLLAGMVIGPNTPGFVSRGENVQAIAEIGVAFLMFAVGAEFSLGELRRFGRVVVLGGIEQIVLTTLLGAAVGLALGLGTGASLLLGGAVALSSTVVPLKLLQARGEASALHGRLTLGFAVLQDLAVVPMVVLMPALGGGSAPVGDLALTVAKAVGLVAVAFLVGTRLVPLLLERAAVSTSRELFLLGAVSLALGTAAASEAVGLSLAFGAFLAGLVIAESEYAHQVIAEVLPLRDLFASLFFVSIGMLVDVGAISASLGAIVPLVLVAIVGKAGIIAVLAAVLGMPVKVALMAGLALAQLGEFSFVVARLGVDQGVLPARTFDLVLGAALVTLVVSPAVLASGPRLLAGMRRVPGLRRFVAEPLDVPPGPRPTSTHAVICGYGRVGRELAEALGARGIRVEVIEYNPLIVADLRNRGVYALYGDAANPAVLAHAHPESARVMAVTLPDAAAAERIVREAKRLNPRLDVVARGQTRGDLARLRAAGASEVVQPEFEGGVEFIRHTMRRFGVLGTELQALTAGRRAAFYTHAARSED